MIYGLKSLFSRGGSGQYVADFRYDENVRIREDFISPCLTARQSDAKDLTKMILLIEVISNDEKNQSEK